LRDRGGSKEARQRHSNQQMQDPMCSHLGDPRYQQFIIAVAQPTFNIFNLRLTEL
jgi:hypothetical protein